MNVRRRSGCPALALVVSLLFLGGSGSAATAAGSMFGAYFESLPGYATTGTWWPPTVGDVDLDGRDDVVRATVPNGSGPGTLLVRFGETTGRLAGIPVQVPIVWPTDLSDAWPCIADLDGDSIPDIILAARTELMVIRGLGGRAFAPAVSWPESCGRYVSSADLNSDGLPDFACVFGGVLRVRYGAGGLNFAPGPSFSTPGNETHLLDFSGDSRPDIYVHGAGLFLNDGSGGFASFNFNSYGRPLGDLDGDGLVDLVDYQGAQLNNGNGTFQPWVQHAPMGDPPCLVDLNEDGHPDLVGLKYVVPAMYIEVALGNGDGTFGPPDTTRTCWDDLVSHGDFDQDGHQDLVLTKWDFVSETYMFGKGNGGFRRGARTFPTGVPGYPHAGNLGPGAHPDLVIAGPNVASIAVLISEGPADYAAPLTYPTLGIQPTIALGDLNGDGRDDVVVGYSSTTQISVWLTQPDGTLGPRADTAAPTIAGTIKLADLDDNGTLDLVSSYNWTWRPGSGSGTFGSQVAIPGAGNSPFDIADLDGNGALDLVSGASSGVRVVLASSPGVFSASTLFAGLSFAPTFVAVGSYDSDTIPDVFVQADSLRVFRGLGGGALGPPISLGSGPGTFRRAGDVNADGLTDFLGYAGSLATGVCLGTGGRPSPRIGYGGVHTANAGGSQSPLTLADVDGNGAPDIVVSDRDANVTVLLNQTITPTVGVPPSPTPRSATRLAVRATPNPAPGRVTLRLELSGSAPVEVAMFDLSGRRVGGATLARPGARSVTVPLEGTERLAPGLYLVRVRQGGETATSRACLMR